MRRTSSCSASTAPRGPAATTSQGTDLFRLNEEAAKRDHRKLGIELDLFSFPDRAGLRVWRSSIPRAASLRPVSWRTTSRQRHIDEAGFEFVNTPHIIKTTLFHISGHLAYS